MSDSLDRALREAMASPTPGLSPAFDRNLAKRLRPRSLSPTGRLTLVLYTLAALGASIWALRQLSLGWIAAILAILISLGFALALVRAQRQSKPR